MTTLHLYQGAFVDIGGVHDGYLFIPGLIYENLTIILIIHYHNHIVFVWYIMAKIDNLWLNNFEYTTYVAAYKQ